MAKKRTRKTTRRRRKGASLTNAISRILGKGKSKARRKRDLKTIIAAAKRAKGGKRRTQRTAKRRSVKRDARGRFLPKSAKPAARKPRAPRGSAKLKMGGTTIVIPAASKNYGFARSGLF